MRLKDLRAIAHISLNRDDPYSGFEAWERWHDFEWSDEHGILEKVDAFANDDRFDSINGWWVYDLLTPVFWVKRIVAHWLYSLGLCPFQIKYKIRKVRRRF